MQMLYANQGRLAPSPFPLSSYPEAIALSVFSQIKSISAPCASPKFRVEKEALGTRKLPLNNKYK